MPYATQRDRDVSILELRDTPWPGPPLNLFLKSGYVPGVFDLSWDDPSNLSLNSRFQILGVNIYRSFDSEFGPYDRINDSPIGSTFWRDQTDNALVTNEIIEDDRWVVRGVEMTGRSGPRYVFKTLNPIVKAGSQNVPADTPLDVSVYVDGVTATVLRVDGFRGEIEIDATLYPEVDTQSSRPSVVPGSSSVVSVSYRFNRKFLRTDLDQRVFYRVTTVGTPKTLPLDQVTSNDLVETPLEHAVFTSNFELEKLDWIWREAVRRNQWILNQGGERVKVFMRKTVGVPCACLRNDYKQPLNDCLICFGVGIVGGFEGPYDIVVAPDDAERRISQQATGRTKEHAYESWTGPSPILSQRDFIVKINGERYSIGPVRMPTNRGMVLQQHFSLGHIDEKDIRYKVPVDQPMGRLALPTRVSVAAVTENPNVPDEQETRGRTLVWENITW